MTEHIPT